MHLLHIVKAVNPLVAPCKITVTLPTSLDHTLLETSEGGKNGNWFKPTTNSQVIVCAETVSDSNSELIGDKLHEAKLGERIGDAPVPVVTSLSSAELRESASLLLHRSTHNVNSRGRKRR